jgi:electron transport complex protein RnfB
MQSRQPEIEMADDHDRTKISRRELFHRGFRIATLLALGGGGSIALSRSLMADTVWQIDPNICVQCGNCQTQCVLTPSAVKCVHAYDVCGYCDLCSGYLRQGALSRDTAAENRMCPTGAIKRTFIEDPYYEYTIDESLCIACGKCVKGCSSFGNGSLFLQVRHDRCLNCNDCSIARSCPSGAFKRVSAKSPYILKGKKNKETL